MTTHPSFMSSAGQELGGCWMFLNFRTDPFGLAGEVAHDYAMLIFLTNLAGS